VAHELLELKRRMEPEESAVEAYYQGRGGGKRDLSRLGVVWRNSTLDGKRFTCTRSWKVPHAGVLSLDFVDIRRPHHLAAQPIADAALDKLVLRKWEEKTSILGLDVYSDAGKVVRSTLHVA